MAKLTPEKIQKIRVRNISNYKRWTLGAIHLPIEKVGYPIMDIEFCGPRSNVTSNVICEIFQFKFRNNIVYTGNSDISLKIPEEWIMSITMNGMGVYFRE